MGFSGKWIFKCLGCKTKEDDDTEYIDLSKIKSVDDVIHINDLVVSKPQLYVDTPKSIFVKKKSESSGDKSFGVVKPIISIPIKNKWPSDISSDDSILLEPQTFENKDNESNKIVIPLSNISGFLDEEYEKNSITISESIAIAENIYQNEKKQIEKSVQCEDLKNPQNKYVETDMIISEKSEKSEDNNVDIEIEFTISPNRSIEQELSINEDEIISSQEKELNQICYLSDYEEDEETVADKMWKVFVKASKVFIPHEYTIDEVNSDEALCYEKGKDGYLSKRGLNEKKTIDSKWFKDNYKMTHQEAMEIVEGTIKKINKGVS